VSDRTRRSHGFFGWQETTKIRPFHLEPKEIRPYEKSTGEPWDFVRPPANDRYFASGTRMGHLLQSPGRSN